MKKIIFIIISLIIVIFFFSCSTNLRIVNESSYALTGIYWINESGYRYNFYIDLVYNEQYDRYVAGMNPGSSVEKRVGTGNCPVFLSFPGEYGDWQTVEWAIVKQWKTTEFALANNTLIERSGKSPGARNLLFPEELFIVQKT